MLYMAAGTVLPEVRGWAVMLYISAGVMLPEVRGRAVMFYMAAGVMLPEVRGWAGLSEAEQCKIGGPPSLHKLAADVGRQAWSRGAKGA